MIRTLRLFIHGTLVILILTATSGSILSQEMKDRELTLEPAYNTIQSPVEIASIRLNGSEIHPGEKIRGDDDWLQGLSFSLKNISDKPIAYLYVGLRFPRPEGFVVYFLSYGVDPSIRVPRTEPSPPAIQPGESFDLVLSKAKYPGFQYILAQGEVKSFYTVTYYIGRVCFENEPHVIWEGGFLKRRDPNQVNNFKIVERYVLPARQE